MFDQLKNLFSTHNIHSHFNQGILVANVESSEKGLEIGKEVLYNIVTQRTALYLSGGRTPKDLYAKLAHEEKIAPGAVGMVDERFGEKWHPTSNEKMLRDSGLLRYFQMRDISFYPIITSRHPELSSGSTNEDGIPKRVHPKSTSFAEAARDDDEVEVLPRERAATEYDQTLHDLQPVFQKHIAILGIGLDGHTAGIVPDRPDFENPLFDKTEKYSWVSSFDDTNGPYKERVTMTFLGLSMMDVLIVLVFGDDKQKSLDMVFSGGKKEDVPGRFLTEGEIAKKTLVITDQRV